MPIRVKLLLSYLAIICATVTISLTAIKSAENIRSIYAKIYAGEIPHLLVLKDLRAAGVRIVASTMEYGFLSRTHPASGKEDSAELTEELEAERRLISEGRAQFLESLAECRRVILLHEPNLGAYPLIRKSGMGLIAASQQYIALIDSKAPVSELLEAKEAFEESEQNFLAVLTASHDNEVHDLDGHVAVSFQGISDAIAFTRTCSLLAVAGSLLLGFALSFSLVRRIRLVDHAAREVAAGNRDITLPVAHNDEITSVSVSFNRMVAELRESQLTLDSTNRYLDSVIATMPEAMVVVSTEGLILDMNHATGEIFGIEKQDLAGLDFAALFLKREEGEEFVAAVIEGREIFGRETTMVGQGTRVHFSLSARMVDSDDSKDRFICLCHDITRSKVAEQEVRALAYFDQLTGLPNRPMFYDRCSHALAQAERHGELAAILFFDLDHFKDINDTMGHHAGDQLLQLVVQRLQKIVRASDTFARFGGDEFALLCSSIPGPEAATLVAEKLLSLMKEPFYIEGRQIHTGASIGVVLYPEDGSDIGTLLKNADLAMYAAKSTGGMRHQFFSQELNRKAQERADIEQALREALRKDELTLHYQPQIDLESGRVIGMEALARWTHPQLGVIPPDRFIPVAEQSGLIVELGQWVLKAACLQCKKWQDHGHPISVAINVSILQLLRSNFAETVVSMLLAAGLEPSCLDLELTESMLMENAAESVALLATLKSIGVKVSVDDFGTGYSSLSYLKNFSVDAIKIDQSFVRDVTTRADAAGIVKAIVAIGHSMALTVIAEGVETAGEIDKLRQCGCDQVQGYYYGKPMPAADATAYLEAKSGQADEPALPDRSQAPNRTRYRAKLKDKAKRVSMAESKTKVDRAAETRQHSG